MRKFFVQWNWTLCLLFFEAIIAQPSNYVPGKSYFGRNRYIEYIAGDLPIIISVPHGGKFKPDEIPDRKYGVLLSDLYTISIAQRISAQFYQATNRTPHLIICHLKRTKIDCNRDITEGTQENKWAEAAWREFQEYIEIAKQTSLEKYSRAFLIDLHGHSHSTERLEIGYLLSEKQLMKNEKDLKMLRYKSSIRFISEYSNKDFLEILRGKSSLGGLMEERGFLTVPAPSLLHPGENNLYFFGAFNLMRHTVYSTYPIP